MSRRKNNNNSNYKTKRWGRTIAFAAAIVLVCTTLMTAVGFMSDGFSNKDVTSWFSHERNTENLIEVEKYLIKDGQDDGNGIKYLVDKDGVIKLRGKADKDINIILAEVVLEAGTYTISGIKSTSDYGLTVEGAGIEAKAGVTKDTFTLEQAATVTVSIYVKEGTYLLGKTIKPVLNKGETPVDFYA